MTWKPVALALIAGAVLASVPAQAQEVLGPTETNVDPQVAWARLGPREMKYHEDQPIPPGYHLDERPRVGFVIAGAILTGLGALIIGASVLDGASHGGMNGDDDLVAALGGIIFVGPGLPMLLVGTLVPKKVLVRNDIGVFVAPMVGQHSTGATLGVRF